MVNGHIDFAVCTTTALSTDACDNARGQDQASRRRGRRTKVHLLPTHTAHCTRRLAAGCCGRATTAPRADDASPSLRRRAAWQHATRHAAALHGRLAQLLARVARLDEAVHGGVGRGRRHDVLLERGHGSVSRRRRARRAGNDVQALGALAEEDELPRAPELAALQAQRRGVARQHRRSDDSRATDTPHRHTHTGSMHTTASAGRHAPVT
jgi:hypothetical protein